MADEFLRGRVVAPIFGVSLKTLDKYAGGASPPASWSCRWPGAAKGGNQTLFLIHFLSGPHCPRGGAIQTTPGGLDLGLRSALAASV
jgi:hypothetical protein